MKKIIKIQTIAILVLFLVQNVSSINIGVSPATIKFKDVLRGGYAEDFATITVDSENPAKISVDARGEIKNWINLSATEFNASKNNPFQLKISVTPPNDTPNGNYTGYLRVMIGEATGISPNKAVGLIKTAVELNIIVEVTDNEYKSCKASNFEIFSAEKGDDVILKVDVLNNGNVRLNPEISADIWNQDQSEIVKKIDYSEASITPTTQKTIVIKIPTTDLDIGQYWADVSALDCYNSYLLTFDVFEPGTLKAKGLLKKIIAIPWINQGDTTKIQVLFQNTGEKNIDAQFNGQIMHNGKIVQLLKSKKLLVEIGQEIIFPFYFTPTKPGKYIISGRVFYDNKRTYEKSAIINVRPIGLNIKKIITDFLYVLLMITIAILLFKIHKEKKKIKKQLKKIK